MIKYRIIYLGNDKYLSWDADYKRFVPACMHLYVTTWDNLDDCMKEMHKVKKEYSGWSSDIFLDTVNRDPLGEHKPEVKHYLFQF